MGAFMDSDKELRRYSVSDDHFREIDLTSSIRQEIAKMGHTNATRSRPVKRKTILSIAVSCVFLLSFTAYAASGHLQIFNSKGEVVVKTTDPSPSLPDKLSNELEIYRKQVLSLLQPGEVAAYYIKDDYINKLNGYDTVNELKFEQLPIDYRSYKDFLAEQARTSAPRLQQPGYIPQGLSFSYGKVFLEVPLGKEREPLKQKLIDRANASKNTDKLFIEKLQAAKAYSSVLHLTDGKNDTAVGIMASYGQGISLTKTPDATSEIIQLKQVEAMYLKQPTHGETITWYDSKQGIVYTIMVNKEGLMSKTELIKMAESLVSE
ncbi:DUF4367 domain-containing protein [Paenibacillus sp. NPDC058177]|uniref:DUF4367 domain-containing protein n=1 Tax=Paenibacillus sp. NPDC058177 TaxID=3346369 RepID=UPI0036DD5D56